MEGLVREPWVAISPLLCLALVACGGGSDPHAGQEPLTVHFDALVNGQPFSCSGAYMMGTPPALARPSHFRMFVYDIAATSAGGDSARLTLDESEWQGNFDDVGHNVALLDFDDATGNCRYTDADTHTVVTGWVTNTTTLTGLTFRIGIPSELDHLDAGLAPPPLNRPGLWSGWQLGSILLRADFDTANNDSHRPQTKDDELTPGGWQFWLADAGTGPQACTGEPNLGYQCANQFQPKVLLDPFDPAQDHVGLDLGALLQDVDMDRTAFDMAPVGRDPAITDPTITTYPMPDYRAGCFMDRVDGECAVALRRLGIDWVTLAPPDATTQDFAVKVGP